MNIDRVMAISHSSVFCIQTHESKSISTLELNESCEGVGEPRESNEVLLF